MFGQRILSVSRTRRRLLIEAAWSLVAAKAMLHLVSFPRLATYFCRRPARSEVTGEARERLCREVASAVNRVASLAPAIMVCFPRAIATHAMLRRRGVTTTMFYGAKDDGQLSAHVWVQDADWGVIGMPPDGEYSIVAKYSPSRSTERDR